VHQSLSLSPGCLLQLTSLFAISVTVFPCVASAQACASCSPLALPASISLPGGGSLGQHEFVLTGQVSAGWQAFPNQTAQGQRFEDPNRARIDLGLMSIEGSVLHRSGIGASVQLPSALIGAADVTGARLDPGLGDLDARVRYRAQPGGRLVLAANVGVVLPTGRYAPRSGALALSAAAQALTPGRGTTWAVAEAQARLTTIERLSVGLGLEGRAPSSDAPDGFRWGPEVRCTVDGQFRLPGNRVFLSLGVEGQWRATSSVDDPFLGTRVDSGSTGGLVIAALPGLTVQLPLGLFAQLSARIPLAQSLSGLQFNQGLGLFAGVGLVLPVGPSRAEASRVTGERWTVVDYDADWCAACQELKPVLEQAKVRFPSVRFTRVDVSQWSQDELEQAVPGATALPVVELRRPDGTVVARLEGNAAQEIARSLETHLP
jgi:thiol-disulfide isomerase/thioredoxin